MRRAIVMAMAFTAVAASVAHGQDAAPAPVSKAEFKSMSWLLGSWRGSGGAYPSFFEDYRLINDSTIRQRSLTDSTFAVVSDSADIEWRNGSVRSTRNGAARSVIARLSGDTLRFMPATGARGGFTWFRVSADEWIALLDGRPGGAPVTYRMRRVRP